MSETKRSEPVACPVCRGQKTQNAHALAEAAVWACSGCGFQFLHPQPSDEVLQRIYSNTYFLGANNDAAHAQVARLKDATANLYLDFLERNRVRRGKLLEVGCGDGYLLAAAEQRGCEVVGVEYSEHAVKRARAKLSKGTVHIGELLNVDLPKNAFDVCVLADVIEHLRDPRSFLIRIRELMKPGGMVFIAIPSTDSWSARVMGKSWMEYKTEHISYFNRNSLQSLLIQTGFSSVKFSSGKKVVSLQYVKFHFEAYPVKFWTTLVRMLAACLPTGLQKMPLRIAGSGMLALAKTES